MKETKLDSNQLEVISNNTGLANYLRGLSEGKKATPRSFLYNNKHVEVLEPDEILKRWIQHLSSLKSGDSFERNVFHFDSHQLEKWGPQGGVEPISDLLEDIVYPTFSGRKEELTLFDTPDWKEAVDMTYHQLHYLGCKNLRPAPLRSVVDDMRARDTLESNSGWPLFTRRNKPEVIEQSIKAAEDGLWKTYPAIALFRNYNRKTRLVWMFPMSANLVEGSFFQPLQQILMRDPGDNVYGLFFEPWRGFEGVRGIITRNYRMRFKSIAASDFSSTDAHFQLDTTMQVYRVLEKCFQPEYRDALKESLIYMHSIPLLIGPNAMLTGNHGVSSGSNWTNFVETVFDLILANYVRMQLSTKTQLVQGLYAIGDDMAWWTDPYDPSFASQLEAIGKQAGQVIKAEKTTNEKDWVVSLQRLFQRGYLTETGEVRAVYPTIRALKSLVYPERFHSPKTWNKDMEAIRAFMILENCVDHPLFEEFCRFVSAGDPHLKRFAMYAKDKQNALLRKSKLIPGLNPTYNQEKRDQSLSKFKSVKFIATL